jgi:glucose uptake protein
MIIPGSYVASLVLLIVSMLCWGSWANTFKLSGPKWRFELFYFDFAAGVLAASLIIAFTFGSLGWDGFSFLDDLRNAGKRQDMYAFVAGCVFNLANMLLVGAISIAGMAVAFPLGVGLALIIGVIWNFSLNPVGNPLLLGMGCLAIVAAIVFDALAYRAYSSQQVPAAPSGRGKVVRKPSSTKGIIIAMVSGILMGSFLPLVEMARSGEVGLGPYAVGFIFAFGVFSSTFVFNLFLMSLPVAGKPVEISSYFKGRLKQHALGLIGGILWYSGAVTNFVAARAEGTAHAGPAVSYAMEHGAILISALWGLIVWKEFANADDKIKSLLGMMLFLFVCGLAAVSLAPLYPLGH